jgi:hypothetical protein
MKLLYPCWDSYFKFFRFRMLNIDWPSFFWSCLFLNSHTFLHNIRFRHNFSFFELLSCRNNYSFGLEDRIDIFWH